ncbi:MAG TPA: asparaginase [Tissierellaceae bacterium]
MKKKIVIIFTGGTISMKIDPEISAAIPALNSSEILSMITNLNDIAEIEDINYGNLPSPHVTPDDMFNISNIAKEHLAKDDVDGVIVTHGTDTLEETAYMLDLTINSEKPVIVVGAMRNSSELGYDGSSNISAAICTAISDKSKNKGVLVVMNNEVNSASEVTKTNTLSLDTFKSPEFGPLGVVDSGQVLFHREIIKRQFINADKLETKVGLIKTAAGTGSDIVDFYIDNNYKGLVIEGLGRGNLPPDMIPGIIRAIDKNIPVVLVSRCYTGRVLDSYGYEGGGLHLKNLGVMFGGNLPGQKARIKLMLALGVTNNLNEIKSIIEEDSFY